MKDAKYCWKIVSAWRREVTLDETIGMDRDMEAGIKVCRALKSMIGRLDFEDSKKREI